MWTDRLIIWPFLGGIGCLGVAVYLLRDLARRNRGSAALIEFARAIRYGTREFLRRQYLAAAAVFALVFLLLSLVPLWRPDAGLNWSVGLAVLIGAACTLTAGAIGMATAVRSNHRTAEAARLGGTQSALCVALSGGAVMGLCVAGLNLIGLSAVLFLFHHAAAHICGFALGSSLTALLMRVGGGIFTKGADIGADTVTRTEQGFSENDARNAALIADNVGDNIGNVIGIGANLMESQIDAIVAAMAIAMTLRNHLAQVPTKLILLPLLVAGAGAAASVLGILYLRNYVRGRIEAGLTAAVVLTAAVTLGASWFLVTWMGEGYRSELARADCTRGGIFMALALGFAAGGLIAFFSEIYTSAVWRPARRIAERGQFGPALAVLEGLSAGMKSSVAPTLVLVLAVVLAWRQAEFYGIAMAGVGMLSMLGIVVALNAFGPIADNAGGLAEISRMDRSVRDIMENLHTAGNMTTAMGKGFANSSAALVALALLLAFIKYGGLEPAAMGLGRPAVLAGLLLGGMFPFYLSALMARSVGSAATVVIEEVRRQIREIPGLREGRTRPDYARCIELAARRAMRGMLGPGVLVVGAPVLLGLACGKATLAGFLAGALACTLALGFQMVNAGGAMDNAKRYIEEGYFGGKGSEAHKAAMVGDTLGDSFKDAVGPALAMAIKLMCVLALLLVPLLK